MTLAAIGTDLAALSAKDAYENMGLLTTPGPRHSSLIKRCVLMKTELVHSEQICPPALP